MKYLLNKNRRYSGITIIETIIYTVLLSLLLTGFISYVYEINIQNTLLNNNIYDAENN